jgi:AcrR family transcriptional regulator
VPPEVKRTSPGLRRELVAITEGRIVAAGSQLFAERGYVATSLSAVAELAGVAPRTVYVRFGSKAKLLDRCIGTSVAGGATEAPFEPTSKAAMTAPTLNERIDALADLSSGIMRRSGRLLAVGQQAAAIEPEIAAMERRAMGDSLTHLRTFAERLAADGMLPERLDVKALSDLLWAIAGPRMIVSFGIDRGWSSEQFRGWLASTLRYVLEAV